MVALKINGRSVTAPAEPRMHLADFIREVMNLTGTHLGCEHGVCGACTILIDGVPVRACITQAMACEGSTITTIEGLDDDDVTMELRAAFSREHALQCGYCTPGMLITARDLVLRAASASDHEIRVGMSGNLCRCTGYVGIVRAIKEVISDRQSRGIAPVRGAGRTELGPAGSGHAPGAQLSAMTSAGASRSAAEMSEADAIVGGLEQARDWNPQATFEQYFVVRHPIGEVWQFFSDLSKVADCLPGASVTGDSGGRQVAGKVRIKVGPIAAEFRGLGEICRDEATYSGTIQGRGVDQRSNSATRGMIRYRLVPETENSTKVELAIGYRLTGALAQFSRSNLVQDIAGRLVAAFAHNVEARLEGKELVGGRASAPGAIGLILAALAERFEAWIRRCTG